jgi:hypothetical protein
MYHCTISTNLLLQKLIPKGTKRKKTANIGAPGQYVQYVEEESA